ncbi:MAG TPA: D-glycerate dehydrogenase [Albitalea sp.]|nr:D-glycerate dehydrogenase [Albitalea sp.]
MARKNVLVFRELPPDQLARLQAAHEVRVANPRVPAEAEAFFAALPAVHGLIGSSYRIDDVVLAQAPNLEVISSISVGIDNYDLPALRRRGVMLCHTPGVLTETTADTIFALVMAASRRLVELALHVREGQWTRNIDESMYGWDVHGKTLGILGYGRIGQALARRAALGFGMPVLYHNPSTIDLPELGTRARHVSFEQLLREADIVAATLPLTEETRGLMGAAQFAAMKPGAIFVNGSRGGIVQEDALLAALDSGHLRAAGLDVFAVEPLPEDSLLRRHARVTALPHIGSATHETRHAMAELATTNLLQGLAGERPAFVVA